MKSILLAFVLPFIASASFAGECRDNAVKAATALYTINNGNAAVTKSSVKLQNKSHIDEGMYVFTYDVVLKDKGFSSTVYRISVVNDSACTVMGFEMPFAG